MTKEIKLPKVSVKTAKLYEKAGFGAIANELPFVARVVYRLRTEKYILPIVLPTATCYFNYTATTILCDPSVKLERPLPSIVSTNDYTTYDEAMDMCLQEILMFLTHTDGQ